jgi:hypothetical protein
MFKLVIIGTIAALASASSHPINSQIVKDIKERTNRWQPHDIESNPLKNHSYGKLMGLLGTVTHPTEEADMLYAPVEMVGDVPANFDWR